MRKVRDNKGITLIALVITIIIMIILAGVSIFALYGDNGTITKASQTRETQRIAEYQEALEIPKATVKLNTLGLTMDDYWAEINRDGALGVNPSDVELERVNSDTGYATFEGKYEYLIEYIEEGDIKITYNGKVEELKPRITKFNLTYTTHSITIDAEAKRAETYDFYISETSGADANPLQIDIGNTTGKCTFDGLTQEKIYYVKVIARNTNGDDSQEKVRKTGTMAVLTDEEIVKTVSPEGWTNGNKITTATINTEKDVSGYTLQYAKKPINDETPASQLTWYNYKTAGVVSEENEKVFFRLTDGANITSTMSIDVRDIDKVKPEVLSSTSATTNTITIKATDDASGIVGYAVTDTITEPASFTRCTNTLSLEVNVGNRIHGSTYYLWVKDEAGNVSEYKQITMGVVTGLTNANTTFTPNTIGWTNEDVTITVSTTVAGYTLQTSKDGNSWETTNSQTFDKNGTIYARVIDSTGQYTGVASVVVANIETTPPTVGTTIAKKSSNSSSIVTSLKATDTGTGLSKTVYYYKLSTASSYTIAEDVYVAMNGSTKGATTEQTKEHTFSGLQQGKTYNFYAEVYDVAGNKTRTPAEGTLDVVTGQVSTLTIAEGTATASGKPITITAANDNVSVIRYTTDGTNPTTSSPEYIGEFNILKNCTIKAIAYDSTGQPGAVATLAVTIDLGNAQASHVRAGYKFMSNNTNQQYTSGTMENKSGYKITLSAP